MQAFGKRGRPIHVIAGVVRPGVRETLQDTPITWHPIHTIRRPPSISQAMIYLQTKRIINTIRKQHPDLAVISLDPCPLADYWVGASPQALWKQAKKRGKFSRSFKPGLTAWQAWAERTLCAHARHILIYSNQARDWFLSHGIAPARLSQVVIPTNLVQFKPTETPIAARQELLIIGTNPQLKGIDIALQAWATITRHHPKLTLRIVCKGWKVPARVKASGLANVEVSPLIPTPEQYYAQARLVLMPSMFESWGNVPLEALACGVPVVVSKQTPSSMIVTAPMLGTVIDRDGQNDAQKLADATLAQLALPDEADAMQLRHQQIIDFQQRHPTSIQWLLAHV
ncbi:MAG: glycosyltransferase family 4 protein [Mariprofundales bacterium]|nr:glycosyltransferase family 4 protein [Mariprofundales bacterium]